MRKNKFTSLESSRNHFFGPFHDFSFLDRGQVRNRTKVHSVQPIKNESIVKKRQLLATTPDSGESSKRRNARPLWNRSTRLEEHAQASTHTTQNHSSCFREDGPFKEDEEAVKPTALKGHMVECVLIFGVAGRRLSCPTHCGL